jgi:hypothetical protein
VITVPQSTVAKPLTPIDFIAAMEEQCRDVGTLTAFANACPPEIVQDERFAKAFKRRLDAIRKP